MNPVKGIARMRDETLFFTADRAYVAHHPRPLWRRLWAFLREVPPVLVIYLAIAAWQAWA